MVSSPWLWRVVFYVAIDDWNTLCNDVTSWDLTLPHNCANQSEQAALSPLQMGSWRVGTWRSNFREPKVALLLAQKSIRRHLGDFLKRKPAPWMLTCRKKKRKDGTKQTHKYRNTNCLPPVTAPMLLFDSKLVFIIEKQDNLYFWKPVFYLENVSCELYPDSVFLKCVVGKASWGELWVILRELEQLTKHSGIQCVWRDLGILLCGSEELKCDPWHTLIGWIASVHVLTPLYSLTHFPFSEWLFVYCVWTKVGHWKLS